MQKTWKRMAWETDLELFMREGAQKIREDVAKNRLLTKKLMNDRHLTGNAHKDSVWQGRLSTRSILHLTISV